MKRCIIGLVVGMVLVSPNVGSAVIVTAHVEVVAFQAEYAFVPLQIGTPIGFSNQAPIFSEFPDVLNQQPLHFFQSHAGSGADEAGIVSFRVLTNGPVLLAVTDRWGGGGNSGGNTPGGWMSQLTTKEEFESQGWSLFAEPILFRFIRLKRTWFRECRGF